MQLALWPQDSLSKDAGLSNSEVNNPTSFSLGHNVNSKEEADAVFGRAIEAGATVVREPEEKVWGGYAGYFQDLDGHLWDVVWNPALTVDD